MMTKTTLSMRGRGWGRSNRIGAIEVIGPQLHRSWIVQVLLALWRWSIEITLAVLVLLAWLHLSAVMPNYAVAMVLAFPIVAACNFRRLRRLIIGWLFVLFTRHRLRTALVQLGSRNRSGKLPWLVGWRPTPVGERVTLLMVAGTSAAQIEEAADALAAACWARQVRVDTNRRMTAFVRVDVIRRDPLDSSSPIGSKLLRHFRRVDPPAALAMPGEAMHSPWGQASYGAATIYRSERPATPTDKTTNNRKPPPGVRPDEGEDSDDGGLSDYV